MKIEPVELEWTIPEMRAMFERLAELRDDVWRQCRVELGDDLPPEATATEIAARRHIVRDARRRAEIIAACTLAADPYVKKMADLVGKYTVPRMTIAKQ